MPDDDVKADGREALVEVARALRDLDDETKRRVITKTVRSQYLTAAVRSAELGTMTPADLDGVLTSLNFSDDAKSWVQLTIATRKLEQLA